MINKFKDKKGITLIALVITIVILIILAAVALSTVLGENGIIARAKQAAMEHKKAQYYEEINIEIVEEQTERQISQSNVPFIVSLNKRLVGEQQASNQTVSTYTKKSWVKNTIMCDNHFNKNEDDLSKNTILIVETTDDYEIYIYVNNNSYTAQIDESSFEKVEAPCMVSFNANGGTGTIQPISIRKNFTVVLPENTLTRANYTFGGWCLNSDGTGTIYTENSTTDPITEDVTFYAIWTLNAVTLSFDGNGADGDMASVPVIINTATRISEMTFTAPEGYEFDKWATNANGTGDNYNDLDNITISNDTTLYAIWKPLSYTISYSLDSGTLTGQKTTYTIEDADFTLVYPIKSNYTFVGWTGSNGTAPEKDVTITTGSIGNRSYTAEWIQDKVDFSATGSVQTYTVPYTGTYKLEVWGAQGGDISGYTGGKGGYSHGEINLAKDTVLYIYCGKKGTGVRNTASNNQSYSEAGGGGGTDISLQGSSAGSTVWDETKHLYSRVIVAGGGSGAGAWQGKKDGSAGGGESGADGQPYYGQDAGGGKQNQGGTVTSNSYSHAVAGSFGKAGSGDYSSNLGGWNGGGNRQYMDSSGGGGGWYGGATADYGNYGGTGGGGSGYVYKEDTAQYYPTGCLLDYRYYLSNAETIAGTLPFTSPSGTSETGHSGDGYARITFISL